MLEPFLAAISVIAVQITADRVIALQITPSREFMMRCGNKVEYSEWRKIVDSHIAYVKLVSRGELTDPVKEAARLEAEEIAEVEEVFDDLDIDGDGQLSEGEIEAAVHQVLEREYDQNGQSVMDQKSAITKEVMAELDIDGDGVVTKEEFQQAALREKEKRCAIIRPVAHPADMVTCSCNLHNAHPVCPQSVLIPLGTAPPNQPLSVRLRRAALCSSSACFLTRCIQDGCR